MEDAFERVSRYAQEDMYEGWGKDWQPQDISKGEGCSIIEPRNLHDRRRVYLFEHLYSREGLNLTVEEERNLWDEKKRLLLNIQTLNDNQSEYIYRADYSAVKPIREGEKTIGFDIVVRHKPYIALSDYLNQENVKSKFQKLLSETSPESEQTYSKEAEKLLRHLAFGMKEMAHVGCLHGHIDPKHIWLDAAEVEMKDYKLSPPGLDILNCGYESDRHNLDEYSAPELFQDKTQEFDVQTDLYSIGVLLYRVLNEGKLPFSEISNSDEEELRNRIEGDKEIPMPKHGSEILKYVTRKLLAHDRNQRYDSLGALEKDMKLLGSKVVDLQAVAVVTISAAKQELNRQQAIAEEERKKQEEQLKIEKEREQKEAEKRHQEDLERLSALERYKVQKAEYEAQKAKDAADKARLEREEAERIKLERKEAEQQRKQQSVYSPELQTSDQETYSVSKNSGGKISGILIAALVIITIVLIVFTLNLLKELADDNKGGNVGEYGNTNSYSAEYDNSQNPNNDDEGEKLELPYTEFQKETQPPTTKQTIATTTTIVTTTTEATTVATKPLEERYIYVGGKYTWDEAQRYCEQHGGHLATIHSEEEWNAIIHTVNVAKQGNPELKFLWLGATSSLNDNMEVSFSWVDDSETNFIMSNESHWYYNERIDVKEPSGYDAYEYIMNGTLIREPYLLLWNIAPRGTSGLEWSLNDVPDVSNYKEYTSSNMGFIMQIN